MSIFKKLGWFFKKEKQAYIFGVGALLIIAVINVLPPKIFGILIDEIREHTLTPQFLLLQLGYVIGIAVVIYCMRYFWRVFIFGAGYRLEKQLREDLFVHFTDMSSNFFHQHRVGDLMAHATNDLKSIQQVGGMGVLQLADSIMVGLSVLVSMLIIDVELTLWVLSPMIIMLIGAQILSKKLHQTFHVAQEAFSEMNNRTHESMNGMKVTKTFGQEKEEIASFKDEVQDVYKKNVRVMKYDAGFDPLIFVVMMLCYCILFVIGATKIASNSLTIGELASLVSFMNMLIWPMLALGFLYNTVERGSVSYNRIEELFQIKSDIVNKEDALQVVPNGDIEFAIKEFAYPDSESIALKDTAVTIKKGNTLGIVGKTGAGKTTIVKLLLREYDVKENELKIAEHNIKDYDISHLHKAFGYVPQDQFLFSATVEDNIRFGNMEATREMVEEVAKIACVHDDIIDFEKGYDTLVGERGTSLSGGQKQRIAIARALLLNPEILILDDSLSAVDAKTEKKILHALLTNRANKTTIIVAHRFSAIQHAQEIIVLDNGEIVERGVHSQLVEMHGWYADIYKQQELFEEKGEDIYG